MMYLYIYIYLIEKVIASWSDIPGTTVTSHIISGCVDKTRSKSDRSLLAHQVIAPTMIINVSRRKELIPVP